ncbi:MAG TPA: sulfotransferase, partial [Solirubrobacteraceae bacterium]|nr:sulfotransferase [Solirubrobacteraceae bacterium]
RSPVVIGGTGGSGTRVVAAALARSGRYLGTRLNASLDALDFAEFDWRWARQILEVGAGPEARQAFERALAAHLRQHGTAERSWGWKHPHSYLLIPFLADRFPTLRFVHVIRDARAIALSANQHQFRRYRALAGIAEDDETVRSRLRFWVWANLRAADDAVAALGDRYLLVRFEDLCAEPGRTVEQIVAFTGDKMAGYMADVVEPPADLDRGSELEVEPEVGEALRHFGYL